MKTRTAFNCGRWRRSKCDTSLNGVLLLLVAGCLENGGLHNARFAAADCACITDCSFSPPIQKAPRLGVNSKAHNEHQLTKEKALRCLRVDSDSEAYLEHGPGFGGPVGSPFCLLTLRLDVLKASLCPLS